MTPILSERDKTVLKLIGSYCEIYWSANNRLAKRQCEKCVYVVRGMEGEMVCVELIYDSIDGEHHRDSIFWVPVSSIQYMRVLSEAAAMRRIETLEREVIENFPRD
ncbi:MAG: hypothetical protein JST40_00650 [Armatimonadetes bacterium]|nr:hypothetical protein [Armatimonadota bacterium]